MKLYRNGDYVYNENGDYVCTYQEYQDYLNKQQRQKTGGKLKTAGKIALGLGGAILGLSGLMGDHNSNPFNDSGFDSN